MNTPLIIYVIGGLLLFLATVLCRIIYRFSSSSSSSSNSIEEEEEVQEEDVMFHETSQSIRQCLERDQKKTIESMVQYLGRDYKSEELTIETFKSSLMLNLLITCSNSDQRIQFLNNTFILTTYNPDVLNSLIMKCSGSIDVLFTYPVDFDVVVEQQKRKWLTVRYECGEKGSLLFRLTKKMVEELGEVGIFCTSEIKKNKQDLHQSCINDIIKKFNEVFKGDDVSKQQLMEGIYKDINNKIRTNQIRGNNILLMYLILHFSIEIVNLWNQNKNIILVTDQTIINENIFLLLYYYSQKKMNAEMMLITKLTSDKSSSTLSFPFIHYNGWEKIMRRTRRRNRPTTTIQNVE